MSFPFQFNYDSGIGPLRDGSRGVLNVQPIIPFKLNEDWNVVIRTIVPLVTQRNIFPGAGQQNGVGDVVASAFLVPAKPEGFIWVLVRSH